MRANDPASTMTIREEIASRYFAGLAPRDCKDESLIAVVAADALLARLEATAPPAPVPTMLGEVQRLRKALEHIRSGLYGGLESASERASLVRICNDALLPVIPS